MADLPMTSKPAEAGARPRFWTWPVIATAAGAVLFATLVAMALAVAATAALAIGAIVLVAFGVARLVRKPPEGPSDPLTLEATRTAEGWAVESGQR